MSCPQTSEENRAARFQLERSGGSCPQLLIYVSHLTASCSKRTGVIDDEIGVLHFFLHRHLGIDARLDLMFREHRTGPEPRLLHLGTASHDDDLVVIFIGSCLDHESGAHDGDSLWVVCFYFSQPFLLTLDDGRVNQAVE